MIQRVLKVFFGEGCHMMDTFFFKLVLMFAHHDLIQYIPSIGTVVALDKGIGILTKHNFSVY
jgi:hypothetical protein